MGWKRAVASILAVPLIAVAWWSRSAPTDAAGVTVEIRSSVVPNNDFVPDPVTIKAGSSVTWHNVDSALHNATFEEGQPSTPNIPPGQKETLTFNTPGTYDYICSLHSATMLGRLIVEPSGAPSPTPTASPTRSPSAGGANTSTSPAPPAQDAPPDAAPAGDGSLLSSSAPPPVAGGSDEGVDAQAAGVRRTADRSGPPRGAALSALVLIVLTAGAHGAARRMKFPSGSNL